jgi:Tfp pilus assembly protein PilV
VLLPELISRCARTLRQAARREDGFSIVEVLVSALLVALAAIGVFAALDSASATSGRNKARNTAASLAESDIERMRAMTPAQVSNLNESHTETVDGDAYTVASRADWVSDSSGAESCSVTNSNADYLKLTSTITSPQISAGNPIKSESIRAVPNGSFGPGKGTLAVEILDRTGTGVPGISVSVSGPQNFTESTNSLGCVLIGYIPVGTYTVSFSKPGHVESKLPNRQNVTDSVVIASEQTSGKSYLYDAAGGASVRFLTTEAVGDPDTVAANGVSFSVGHTGLGLPDFKAFSGPVGNTMTSGASHTLVPFASAYGVWAGSCKQADPTVQVPAAPANPPLTVPPGATSAQVDVRQPLLRVTVNNSSGTATNAARVTINHAVPGCAQSIDVVPPCNWDGSACVAPAPPTGVVMAALPYGDYSVCASTPVSGPTRRIKQTKQNKVANGTNHTVQLPGSNTTPATCP